MSTLFDLREGEYGLITKVRGRGAFRKRITEMGFIRGKEVIVIKAAPLQDPVEYKILGYNVSLRQSEAKLIEIIPMNGGSSESADAEFPASYQGTFEESSPREESGDREES